METNADMEKKFSILSETIYLIFVNLWSPGEKAVFFMQWDHIFKYQMNRDSFNSITNNALKQYLIDFTLHKIAVSLIEKKTGLFDVQTAYRNETIKLLSRKMSLSRKEIINRLRNEIKLQQAIEEAKRSFQEVISIAKILGYLVLDREDRYKIYYALNVNYEEIVDIMKACGLVSDDDIKFKLPAIEIKLPAL